MTPVSLSLFVVEGGRDLYAETTMVVKAHKSKNSDSDVYADSSLMFEANKQM